MTGSDRQRVIVVTGGGGGIGAAIAEELGRTGAFVVTVDPLVSVDGTEQLPAPEETTAGRIVAAGGSARASAVSVTDAEGVRRLFESLVDELGGLDGVVNVAGITRPTSFAKGTEEDWAGVLSVHLDGYLNILNAALPIMVAAGHGHILGVTSGSGWRPANAGAYSCAKRAVAALTWELGRLAPPGVVINAMSPIAATRMVTAALSRAQPAAASRAAAGAGGSTTGGLSLAGMPAPEELGPLGAHLVAADFSVCQGRVIFAGGSEVAVIDEPRFLEVVRAEGVISLAHTLDSVITGALAPAEANQATTGGSNSRFSGVFDEAHATDHGDTPAPLVKACAIVTDRPEVGAAVAAALDARGVACSMLDAGAVVGGFRGAADALTATATGAGPLDAVIVALGSGPAAAGSSALWERALVEHAGIVAQLHDDARWARATADHAENADRPVRLVTLSDATTAGGRSRAQAAAQLARAARGATGERVSAFAVSVEAPWEEEAELITELVAHLVISPDGPALSGAELAVGGGWFGLRSHPHPTGSITFGGPAIPTWFDEALRRIVGEEDR